MSASEWILSENLLKSYNEYFNYQDNQENSLDVEILRNDAIELNLLSKTSRIKITKKNCTNKPIYVFAKKRLERSFHHIVTHENIKCLFERENNIYRDFVNEIPKVLQKINDNEKMSPIMFDLPNNQQDYVFLEDLTVLGYKSQGKFLNLEQSEKVFVKMAKLHALSFYMHHAMGKNLDKFTNSICPRTSPTYNLKNDGCVTFFNAIKNWEGFSSITEKLEKFLPHYMDALRRNCDPNPPGAGYNVLNHADFHIGNVLIQETTQNIVLIDYQFSAWRSPAYDLYMAFNSICLPEVNLKYRNHLIEVYHKEFNSLLMKLGYTQWIPTLQDVHLELDKHAIFEIVNWTYYMPLFMRYDQDNEDYYTRFKLTFQDAKYQKIVKKFLPNVIDKGFLDI